MTFTKYILFLVYTSFKANKSFESQKLRVLNRWFFIPALDYPSTVQCGKMHPKLHTAFDEEPKEHTLLSDVKYVGM